MNSQEFRIINHLATGKTLTPMQALSKWGVGRLAARIHRLRSQGHWIVSDKVRVKSGARVSRYMLCR